jgi:hypothetical protein
MAHIAEALVRSRCNLISPASFIDIMNPPEAALVEECARRGVFVSQHHVEPLGVSAFSYFNYWKKRGRDLKYSYFSYPAEVREVWRAYAKAWAKHPHVIWQLGLRGIADRPMWMADPKALKKIHLRYAFLQTHGRDHGMLKSGPNQRAIYPLQHLSENRQREALPVTLECRQINADPDRALNNGNENDPLIWGNVQAQSMALLCAMNLECPIR